MLIIFFVIPWNCFNHSTFSLIVLVHGSSKVHYIETGASLGEQPKIFQECIITTLHAHTTNIHTHFTHKFALSHLYWCYSDQFFSVIKVYRLSCSVWVKKLNDTCNPFFNIYIKTLLSQMVPHQFLLRIQDHSRPFNITDVSIY